MRSASIEKHLASILVSFESPVVKETMCKVDGPHNHNQLWKLVRWSTYFEVHFISISIPSPSTGSPAFVLSYVLTYSPSEAEIRREVYVL